MAEVFDCTTTTGLLAGVAAAVDTVRRGGLVVLPTDTVYGIGCDAFDAAAVRALLAAKGRDRQMPPPVLIPSSQTVDGLARDVPVYARDLMAAHWPGPTTPENNFPPASIFAMSWRRAPSKVSAARRA